MGGYFHCIELVRTIYGLQKALLMCNETFDGFVRLIRFLVSVSDPCIYIEMSNGHRVLLLVYVNDVLVKSS